MDNNDSWICIDGEIKPTDAPVIPVNSRGLMYGEGVFDTLRIYHGKTFLFEKHLERSRAGLKALGMASPPGITANVLKGKIAQLLEKQKLMNKDVIVRWQFWRDGSRGYQPTQTGEVHYSIMASQCPEQFKLPHLVTIDRRRIPSEALPSGFKFTNGINYILAAREATEKGGTDALMQTVDGVISETTLANIFWKKGDTIFTPSKSCDLLPGITRNILIDLIKQQSKFSAETGQYPLEHILTAEMVWICNSVRELLAVNRIDEKQYITGDPTFRELKQKFHNYRQAHLEAL